MHFVSSQEAAFEFVQHKSQNLCVCPLWIVFTLIYVCGNKAEISSHQLWNG
jgi:hypothetical protein